MWVIFNIKHSVFAPSSSNIKEEQPPHQQEHVKRVQILLQYRAS